MKVGIIGCGNMGSAIAKAIATDKQINIYISSHNSGKRAAFAEKIGAKFLSNEGIAKTCDFIFLGVKPGAAAPLLGELKAELAGNAGGVLVSMVSGVGLGELEEMAGKGRAIVRIMPNTPAAVGRGMIQWCANAAATEENIRDLLALLAPAGRLDEIDERLMNAAAAVSGCGPAFAYLFAEALADGGVQCGLSREKAMLYAAEMLSGAAEMLLRSGKHPGQLKDEVCSPGGTTIVGVHALEEGGFRAAAQNAVISAFRKSQGE